MSLLAWIHIEDEMPSQSPRGQILAWGRHYHGEAKAWVLEWDADSAVWCLPESHDPVVFQYWMPLSPAPIEQPLMIEVNSLGEYSIPPEWVIL